MSGAMTLGRRAGLLHRTLAEHAEDWLDDAFAMRGRIGRAGVALAEQTTHLAASILFGAAYGAARRPFNVPPILAGTLYGAGLYAINIVGIAPLIGLTRGEGREPPGVVAQRFAMHVLFGVATAMATERLIGNRPPEGAAAPTPYL
ncbi:MAG TPA: hypothetical protein VJ770_21320 [Stellaceae bacterium]|nr:hypothetical protein [Stellaceae bacterium]